MGFAVCREDKAGNMRPCLSFITTILEEEGQKNQQSWKVSGDSGTSDWSASGTALELHVYSLSLVLK